MLIVVRAKKSPGVFTRGLSATAEISTLLEPVVIPGRTHIVVKHTLLLIARGNPAIEDNATPDAKCPNDQCDCQAGER